MKPKKTKKEGDSGQVIGWEDDAEACGHQRHSEAQRYLQILVCSPYFEAFTSVQIILNVITIGMQTQHMARDLLSDTPTIWRVTELFFCCWFTAEIALNVCAFGRWYFWMPGCGWNIFDCIVIAIQLIEEILLASRVDQSALNGLRALRVVRVLRVLRVLRLLEDL